MTCGYALFDTAVGRCGIAWGEAGITAVQLPGDTDDATRARLARYSPDAPEAEPPAVVAALIARVVELLNGEPVEFADAPLDWARVSDFERRVYEIALAIPPGRTRTYGEIAAELGDRGAAQAVGRALGRNPWPIVVPCHRVLGADGKAGGFSAPGGLATKARMLSIEGARTGDQPTLFDAGISVAPRRR